jgi:hypothetical protein
METQIASADAGERKLAATQLDSIVDANRSRGWSACRDAVLDWHFDALAKARTEAWVPRLARSPDPAVEEALGRFYRYHIRLTIERLKAENLELRRKLFAALATVGARFVNDGATAIDSADTMLEGLQSLPG